MVQRSCLLVFTKYSNGVIVGELCAFILTFQWSTGVMYHTASSCRNVLMISIMLLCAGGLSKGYYSLFKPHQVAQFQNPKVLSCVNFAPPSPRLQGTNDSKYPALLRCLVNAASSEGGERRSSVRICPCFLPCSAPELDQVVICSLQPPVNMLEDRYFSSPRSRFLWYSPLDPLKSHLFVSRSHFFRSQSHLIHSWESLLYHKATSHWRLAGI